MKDLLLTGATGFIGKNIIDYLTKSVSIDALTRQNLDNKNNINYIQGDITKYKTNQKYNYIIHCATPTDNQDNISILLPIIQSTVNIIDIAKKSECSSLLYLSSGAANLNSKNHYWYGLGKRISELLLFKSNLKFNIARGYTFTGNYLPFNRSFAIAKFIDNAIMGKDLVVYNTLCYRSYMHTSDLSDWLVTLLLNPRNSIYNVGSDVSVSMTSLAREVRDIIGSKSIVKTSSFKNDTEDRYIPDISKTKNDFGLRVNVCLREAIQKTYEWRMKEIGR